MAQNSSFPRSQEDYITHVSKEIGGRVMKKLFQEFSRTENRILGALSRLDVFLQNPLIQGQSESAPETSGNSLATNQGTNEEDSHSDPDPETGVSLSLTTNSDPDEIYDRNFLKLTETPNLERKEEKKTMELIGSEDEWHIQSALDGEACKSSQELIFVLENRNFSKMDKISFKRIECLRFR